ncbi:MAG: hypothetical protein IJU41_06480 [Clostridia bacterium]|nr:hypothetical protein [Clostridia bacterium]
MNDKDLPTLDFTALSGMGEEERAAALDAYKTALDDYRAASADAAAHTAALEEELKAAKYEAAKYRLCGDSELEGFGARLAEIEGILESMPALASLSDEEKLRTAYYIDRGRTKKSGAKENLAGALAKDPEAVRLAGEMLLRELSDGAPALFAGVGGASLPLGENEKPKTLKEAGELARKAFGV